MDFTQSTFKSLLQVLQSKYYDFFPLKDLVKLSNYSNTQSLIILRHDVDHKPQNALKLAQFEYLLGIKGTYYFRVVPESYDLEIMNKIAELGHEIGYHYENVDFVSSGQRSAVSGQNGKVNQDKLIDLAYDSFCTNLEKFRKVADIKTICMHGSPHSKYDNRMIWEKYDYKKLGIVCEPYFDISWNDWAYFTDTGRRWNGDNMSIRDKVDSKYKFNFKTTQEIINNIEKLPNKIMFTIHPERWNDKFIPWAKQLVKQNVKNVVKKAIITLQNQTQQIKY